MPGRKGKGSPARRRRSTVTGTARTSRKAEPGALTKAFVTKLDENFYADPMNRMRQNMLAEGDPAKMVLNQQVAMSIDRTCSKVLDDWEPTDQKKSGRCWLFGATNLLRAGAMKKLKLKGFEFSQNYLMYWDKFEKANYFLEAIIETADRDIDDRTVRSIFHSCVSDGGQWNMFANIVRKYGLVPKAVMPETNSSSGTSGMNRALTGRLRVGAKQLRDLAAGGTPLKKLRQVKLEILADVHKVLRMHLGNPPTKFSWQWKDNKKKLHRETNATPQAFAKKYVTIPLEEYVCLVHDPRKTSPTGRTFTVEYLGNVIDGRIVTYLNVEMGLMKKIALKTIMRGEPVWFGCDCSKQMHRDMAVWDKDLFDYETLYGFPMEITSKEDRLLYGATAMNHAMLFTGVDVKKGKPTKWRVENSWGKKGVDKGFYLMNDSWFDEHLFEIAARKADLPVKLQRALKQAPIVLPAWDPMGSLAG